MKTHVLIFLILAIASVAMASSVPQRMSYQGVLTDGAGTPVKDGSYDVTFSIYTAAVGGSPLWTETNSVFVSGGIFSLMIGTLTPIDLPFEGSYFMGISVDGGDEFSPRRQLTTSPYAFNAEHVMGYDNLFGGEGNVGIGTPTPTAPLEIRNDNYDANPAIQVTNNQSGGASYIDFVHSGLTRGRVLSEASGAMVIAQLQKNHIKFRTGVTNRMTVASDGNVMVGESETPVEKLEVEGGVKLGTTTGTHAGTLRWTGADFEGYDGGSWVSLTGGGSGSLPAGTANQTLRHNGSSWEATSSLSTNGVGGIEIGSPSQSGSLGLFRSGSDQSVVRGYTSAHGGGISTYDEVNNQTTRMEADVSGTGGTLYVKRNTTYSGFYVEGNWGGSEEPGVGITGSSRSAVFRMDQSDDDSVVLPVNAISSAEMLDEPGVGSANMGTGEHSLTTGYSTILSRSITVPAPGYVLVIGTTQMTAFHTTGSDSRCDFGVSNVAGSIPGEHNMVIEFYRTLPSADYMWPVTVQALFEVSTSGTHTFYFAADKHLGIWSVGQSNLTVVYLPTAYGTVNSAIASDGTPNAAAPKSGGMTAADLATERVDSEAANRARIEREMNEMRERLERLEEELAAEREGR